MTLIDDIGWQLLRDLQRNARLPFAELGRRVGLSLPAVAERVRRMEELGIIEGYRAEVSAELIGLPLMVFIQLKASANFYTKLVQQVEHMPEILECHHITGVDSFIIKAAVRSKEHLAEIICSLSPFGPTTTSLVLSTPISNRVLEHRAELNGGVHSNGALNGASNGAKASSR
ncbi:MAG: Lrp/AsnC family transcriptional regulator [Cyanobacteria bacterium P01_A01_bin.3]